MVDEQQNQELKPSPRVSSGSIVDKQALTSIFNNPRRKIKTSNIALLPAPPPPPSGPSSKPTPLPGSDEGWEKDFQKLEQYLNSRGLRIERVASDGSCMFSSFSRYFESFGDECASAEKLRDEAVEYLLSHEEDFAPFIDTEIYVSGFADYCDRMKKPSTWGGQLELQALSKARKVNVYVFQTGGKAIVKMINFDEDVTPCVTVSYHDGEHYNSVLPIFPVDGVLTVHRLESMIRGPDELLSFTDNNAPRPSRKKKTGLFN